MNAAHIIDRERDGGELSRQEISRFIGGYARGDVPDYQMVALAMAVFCAG
jgi:pyrimidine-nucleoside phosphorylase